MTCQQCGNANPISAAYCVQCGRHQQYPSTFAASAGSASGAVVHDSVIAASMSRVSDELRTAGIVGDADRAPYASFLRRLVAFVLDEIFAGLLAGVTYGVMMALAALVGASSFAGRYQGGMRTGASVGVGILLLVLGGFLALAVWVLYFVKFETGRGQATPGKSLLGIRVTTMSGASMSVGQSLGRLIVKHTISGLFFFLGFLMAAFTEQRQALHDFLAGTLVVRR